MAGLPPPSNHSVNARVRLLLLVAGCRCLNSASSLAAEPSPADGTSTCVIVHGAWAVAGTGELGVPLKGKLRFAVYRAHRDRD